MPGMDGIDLAQAVQETSPQTHIILMTAYSNSALAEQAEKLHLDGYLTSHSPSRKSVRWSQTP